MSKPLGKGNTKLGEISTETLTGHWLPAAAGIDIHKETLTVVVLIPDFATKNLTKHTQKTSTSYSSLRQLRDWLLQFQPAGLTSYGIEATSTYYRPVEYALRDHFDQVLINPYLLKEARKTDAKDAGTIAYVVLTGMFKPNFVIPEIQTQLKTINRRYAKTIANRTQTSNAINTTFTNYNILLGQQVRMLSTSGLAIIKAICEGETDPATAAAHATYYSQSTSPDRQQKYAAILETLHDLPTFPPTPRFTIQQLYNKALFLDDQAAQQADQLNRTLTHYAVIDHTTGEIIITAQQALELLMTVPGVSLRFAQTFIAEAGIDMRRFPSAPHLVSYCGLNPQKRVSADKVKSGSALPGNTHIHSMITQVAQGLIQKSKNSPIGIWGRQYRSRNGGNTGAHNMAVAAVAKRLAHAIWYVLTLKQPYNDSKYDYTAAATATNKNVKKLLRQANDIASIPKVDIDEHTRTQLVSALSIIANAAGVENTRLRIVPGKADTPITHLNLPKRVQSTLEQHNISLTSQLIFTWATQTLSSLPGIGEASVTHIIATLTHAGYLTGD